MNKLFSVFFISLLLEINAQGRYFNELARNQQYNQNQYNQLIANQNAQKRLFFDIKGGGGGGSSYGAPPSPQYGVPGPNAIIPPNIIQGPTNRPAYNNPGPTNRPSYGAPQSGGKGGFNFPDLGSLIPNKGGGGGSYGGKAPGGKVLQIPLPDLPFPDPIEFKSAVLRSKGRIASGLLHTKAGLLRAGANILAQKANAIDKFAQAIPAMKANLINKMKGNDQTGYGVPQAPPQTGYNRPAVQPPPAQRPSYNAGGGQQSQQLFFNKGGGGGGLGGIGDAIGNIGNSIGGIGNSFTGGNTGNSFNSGGNSGNSFNSGSNTGNSFGNGGNTNFVNNNFQPSNQDSYGSPQGNVISSNSNSGNFAVGSSLTFGNNGGNSGNSFTPSSSFSNNGNSFNNGNSNGFSQQQTFSNNNNNQDNYGSPIGSVSTSISNNQNQLSSSNGFNPLTQSTLEQTQSGLNPGQVTSIMLNDLGVARGNVGEKLVLQESVRNTRNQNQISARQNLCQSDGSLQSLLTDIFMGNEMIPDIIDSVPRYPLDLTYKTIRTFPGMRLTADMTRFKPMLKWPAQPDSLYTVVLSNLDINSRRNRTLSEFWHWFVANIPGDSVDDGEVIFDLLFPLVLPEGDGDHRYGYFVFEQPGEIDYAEEGGPTDSCSPSMSNGRGPFKSTKNFAKKYGLDLTASTFLIIDSNEASMEIACEWQKCIGDTINLVSPLQCGK